MNIIKGLMIKDLLQLKSYKKSLIISLVIYILIAMSQSNINGISGMLIIMLTLLFGMYSIASFNYDEVSKSDKFILTLPLTRKEIILSKYIFVIGSTILGCVFSLVISFLVTFIFTKSIPNILEFLYLGIGAIFGIGIIESIQIPCIYKWGAEKGRLQMFVLIILMSFLLGGISYLTFDMTNISNIINLIEKILPFILLILAVIMYFISYKVSYKIYIKKEV